MKRLRAPKVKEGQLCMYWGRERPGEPPEVMYAWCGDSSMKRDGRLLHYVIGTEKPDLFATPLFSKMNPSLIEELISRGYDITTLKFSIMKRADWSPEK